MDTTQKAHASAPHPTDSARARPRPGHASAPRAGDSACALPAENDPAHYAFSHAFLKRLGLSPEDCIQMSVRGSGMEPTLKDGDDLLLERGPLPFQEGGLYVVCIDGEYLVKRAQKALDGWNLCVDAPNRAPIHVPDSEKAKVTVYGRIRWFGRTV